MYKRVFKSIFWTRSAGWNKESDYIFARVRIRPGGLFYYIGKFKELPYVIKKSRLITAGLVYIISRPYVGIIQIR